MFKKKSLEDNKLREKRLRVFLFLPIFIMILLFGWSIKGVFVKEELKIFLKDKINILVILLVLLGLYSLYLGLTFEWIEGHL